MSVLGLRGSLVTVRDQVTGTVWSGRVLRVVDENPRPGGPSMVGFFFGGSTPPSLSTGSVVSFKSRRFAITDAGSVQAALVNEIH